jgi:solute carrier family 39 (zinc transporter), member 7
MVPSNAFAAALISTALISLAPNLLLFAFPGVANAADSPLLSLGQALAAGSLLGDVFLHTLSHATDHDAGFWVLVGFTIFLFMDMMIRSLQGHSHQHQNQNPLTVNESKNGIVKTSSSNKSLFTPTVLLNLTADALHNFTDGLAIGASFATSSGTGSIQSVLASRGGLATLSIFFHEIPHELGDYCILLKGGFSKNQAILAQFGTALAAMLGTVVGIYATESWGGIVYITAGGFVYLAAVNLLPEVLEPASTRLRLGQIVAFLMGIAFLYAVHLLENDDHHAHSHHTTQELIHDHHDDHHNHDRHHHHHNDHDHHGHNHQAHHGEL